MRNEVRTVGDLSGKHVGVDTVRIAYQGSVIEGVISELTITAENLSTLSGELHYRTLADIKIEDSLELRHVPMDAPASIVTRSDPQ